MRLTYCKLLKTSVEKMSVFRLSMMLMKINIVSEIDEKARSDGMKCATSSTDGHLISDAAFSLALATVKMRGPVASGEVPAG